MSRSGRPPRSARPQTAPVPGIRAIAALLDHQPERIRRIEYSGDRRGARARLLDHAARLDIPTSTIPEKELSKRLPDLRTQGIIAWVEPATYVPWDELISGDRPLLVAVDQVTDPRNLGAILRAAEGMGSSGALLTSNRCARLGPTVSRTSAGASELIPVAMETNLARSLDSAREAGCAIVGADLDGQAPEKIDLSGPVVLVIGAEGRGLRRLTRARCDVLATIPLTGFTESLNAATAAAILVYEATRQRRSEDLAKRSENELT